MEKAFSMKSWAARYNVKYSVWFCSLLAGILFTGCLEISTTIRVKPDGTGTITEQMIIDRSLTDMALGAPAAGKTQPREYGLYTSDELAKRASEFGEGVRFQSVKPYNEKTRTGYTAVYSFTNLEKVQIGINPESNFPEKSLDLVAQAKTRKPPQPFRFGFSNGKITVNMPVANFTDSLPEFRNPAIDAASEGTFGNDFIKQLAKMFSLKLKVSIIPEGKVTATNAPYRTGNEFTLFALDFGEIMQDAPSLRAVSKTPPKNIDEAKKMLKTIKGITIPLDEQITIQFKNK